MNANHEVSCLIATGFRNARDRLAEAYPELMIDTTQLTEQALEKLADYTLMLERWSSKIDLVSPAPIELLVERHIVDSLCAWLILQSTATNGGIIDVGSGAGLPGVVLAICEPKWRVVLNEPREKRAIFLAEVRRNLDLGNVSVATCRFEDIADRDLDGIRAVVSRALGREKWLLTTAWLKLSKPFRIIWMVTPDWQAPISQHSVSLRSIKYEVSSCKALRQISILECFT